MASYYLCLSVDPVLGRLIKRSIGPHVVVKGSKPPVKEEVEATVNQWLKNLVQTQMGLGPKDLIRVKVEHGGYLKRLVLLEDNISMERVFDAVWSSIEKHHIGITIEEPRGTKKSATPSARKDVGRL